MTKNYDEKLLQASDILIKKRLEALSFDTTIEATIVDDSKASQGIYTVSNGNAKFLAYSADIGYVKNEVVLVTIPQSDYNNQKTIIGRKVSEANNNSPLSLKSPFTQMINITNNLIQDNIEADFWANGGKYYGWDIDNSDFYDYIELLNKNNPNQKWITPIATYSGNNTDINFTKIGLKADFACWLEEYQTRYGNYGIIAILTFKNLSNNLDIIRTITLDSNEFFGNVYNFEIYNTQEAVFDISELKEYVLDNIKIYAYQRNNFKKSNNELIYPIHSSDSTEPTDEKNISIKNIEIYLGVDAEEFEKDSAEILNNNSEFYYQKLEKSDTTIQAKNEKSLKLRWIHKDETTELISVVEEDQIPAGYEVRWYHYKQGANAADEFIGASWERFYGCNNTPDLNGDYCKIDANGDLATNHINDIKFYPNVSNPTEQLKVIIIKERPNAHSLTSNTNYNSYEKVAESSIITFKNTDSIVDKKTKMDVNALSIRFDDKEKGNYFLYNRAGNVSKSADKQFRTLTAVFDETQDDVYQKPVLTEPFEKIVWSIPANNTMIIPAIKINNEIIQITKRNYTNYSKFIEYNNDNQIYKIFYPFKSNETGSVPNKSDLISIGYYINSSLIRSSTRNTVVLDVWRNGQYYRASEKMLFGTAGTSGSDYTIIVEWENGENAFDINKGTLTGEIKLLDQAGNEVELGSNATYEVTWPDKGVRVVRNNQEYVFGHNEETNKELYYPVITQINNSIPTGVDAIYVIGNPNLESPNATLDQLYYYNIWCNNYYHNKKNYSYWVSGYNESNLFNQNELVTYDLQINDFISIDTSDALNSIVYAKTTKQMYKMEFYPVDTIKTDYYSKDNINYSGVLVFENNGTTTYYYPKSESTYPNDIKRRLFIKWNDTYIIDPWETYHSDETYYYPLPKYENDYNSTDNTLKIYQSNQNNNIFTISDDRDEQRIPHIDTDLYILQVKLKNFKDYDLTAYFPIALKESDIDNKFIVDYIEGADEVRYATDGELDFNKNPYSIHLRVLTDANKEEYKAPELLKSNNSENKPRPVGHWELVYNGIDNNEDKSIFYPSLREVNRNYLDYEMSTIVEALINKLKQTDMIYILLTLIDGPTNTDNYPQDYKNSNLKFAEGIEELISRLTQQNLKPNNAYDNYYQNWTSLKNYTFLSLDNKINYNSIGIQGSISLLKILKEANKEQIQQLIEKLKKISITLNRYYASWDVYSKILYRGELLINAFTEPILDPPSVYFEDTPLYGIKFVLDKNIYVNENGEVVITASGANAIIQKNTTLWMQPIYSYRDNYPSTTLNRWNGRDITTNNETGIISANGFSAGRKESNNTFTGVIMGDWSRTDSDLTITKQTGVFGFKEGEMSFALKDDGTAFFGKDGKGKIYFDGNNAQIYSSQWISPSFNSTSKKYTQNQYGMMLDIDDGILNIISPINSNNKSFSLLANSLDSTFLLNIGYETNIMITTQENDIPINIGNESRQEHFRISSKSPFLSIGCESNTFWTNNFQYNENLGKNITINEDYIRITDHGGFLSSANFSPTISVWLTQKKTDSKYYKGDSITIYPDDMYKRSYHCWGDKESFPFTGMVLDLTHGMLMLGNDAEIKGYQTGKWGPSHLNLTERVFHISNGSISKKTNDGRYVSTPNSSQGDGYFILAQTVFGNQTTDPSYEDIFRVDWNGSVYCGSVYCERFYIRSGNSWKPITF